VVSLPVAASAQSADAKYCTALSDKYSRYLDMSSKKGAQPQSLDAKASVGKCQAGDTASSIPVLEKALKDAKLDLPPRT
jgi:ligand-binding sensor protein